MVTYCKEIRKLEAHFYGLEFHHVLRDYNVAADVLSKLGSKRALVPTASSCRLSTPPLSRSRRNLLPNLT